MAFKGKDYNVDLAINFIVTVHVCKKEYKLRFYSEKLNICRLAYMTKI